MKNKRCELLDGLTNIWDPLRYLTIDLSSFTFSELQVTNVLNIVSFLVAIYIFYNENYLF